MGLDRRLPLTVLTALALVRGAQAQDAPAPAPMPSTLIRCGRLIDGTGHDTASNVAIVVEGERIKLLATQVIDGAAEPGTVLDERLAIACGVDALSPVLVQRAGKSPMSLDDFLRGFSVPVGTRLP